MRHCFARARLLLRYAGTRVRGVVCCRERLRDDYHSNMRHYDGAENRMFCALIRHHETEIIRYNRVSSRQRV